MKKNKKYIYMLIKNLLISDVFISTVFINTILNAIIIICIILLIFNAILFLHIDIKITKRREEPLEIIIYICFRFIQKRIKNNPSSHKPSNKKQLDFNVKDLLFSSNLNEDLKKLKNDNFYIYVLLEYARVTKFTYIPVFSSKHELFMPLFGFGSWMSVAAVKRYVESTFKYVDNDYYQIMMDDHHQGLMFEIELKVRLFDIMIASLKNYKLLKKTIKKKEG